ncbi:MAG: DUF523 domain-containing protein [Patescibacteria group bacterium]|jgi:uncharacterized protein YbbK (DUF523 family)
MKIVSACLAGLNCRCDGDDKSCPKIVEMVREGKAIPVCPEQLGGLPTPRLPSEQKGDRVFTKDGQEVTEQFKKGAQAALEIAQLFNCKEAILKSKSPSCGCGKVFDGTFSGNLIDSDGVTTKLFKENNINVLTEKDL